MVAVVMVLICLIVAVPARSQVQFPGPQVMEVGGEALSAVSLPLEVGNPAYLVAGSGDGALTLFRYSAGADRFLQVDNILVGGKVVHLVPWEGRPLLNQGVVAATANPDRVVFLQVLAQAPYFTIEEIVDLDEDPGTLSFVGEVVGGVPELAVSLPGIDQVALLKQDEGLWNIAALHDTGDRPFSIMGIDLDGDQVRELVTANRGPLSENLGIYRRDASGSYAGTRQEFPAGTPTHLAAHDLDGDGRIELAATVEGVPEAVFFNAVGGQLVETETVGLTLPADGLHLTGLYDGTVGLFASNMGRGLVEFFQLRNGSWDMISAYYPGCHPLSTASGDFNGDGGRDLVSLGGDGNRLTVMFANTRPGFGGYPALALNASPGASEMGDFDGDGLRDLVVANGDLPLLSFFPGHVGGGFATTPVGFDLSFFPGKVAVVDTDDDPAPELAILDIAGDRMVIADYVPGQGFALVSETPTGDFPGFIISRDLDADGFEDLLILTREVDEVTILFGAGDHSFPDQTFLGLDNGADWISLLDLDADGLPDLVFSDGFNRVWTTINQGDRSFGTMSWLNAGSGPGIMAVGDLDQDGDEDLVVVNKIDVSLSMFENSGTGSLVRRVGAHALASRPAGILVRDMDQDGLPEIVMNLREDKVFGISFPLGNWTWSQTVTYPGGPSVSEFRVGDFNSDGVADILTLDSSLRLGLTLLNMEPELVAVEPTALAAECSPAVLKVRVRPDRPGPWTVAFGSPGHWTPLAVTGRAVLGDLDYDRDTWIITVPRRELEGLPGDGWLRLTVGADGDSESLDLALADLCPAAAERDMPGAAWAREPWPNPFNPLVHARFTLARGAEVTAGVYDLAGRRVAILADGWHGAGDHDLQWDGRHQGRPAGGGVYLLRISTPENTLIHKVMLLK
ncbi:MAG: FG-GAP-like repeat-containing protein [Candidatus Krumholzibacteriota bacterium]